MRWACVWREKLKSVINWNVQLKLHDGMFECDCTQGYELNLDGYGCRPTNISNSIHETRLDDDYSSNDVFYQKGVSFSAKLEEPGDHENNNDISNDLQQHEVDNQRCVWNYLRSMTPFNRNNSFLQQRNRRQQFASIETIARSGVEHSAVLPNVMAGFPTPQRYNLPSIPNVISNSCLFSL